MNVGELVNYLSCDCDGDETQLKVEVRGWYNNKMIIHYLRDYDKTEPQMPKVIEDLEVGQVYAKAPGHFVIDVVVEAAF